MSVSVRLRMVSRRAFNRLADEIEQMLNHQDVDYDVLASMIARLERRMQELEKMDRAILEEMLSVEDMPEVDIDEETKEADDIAIRGFYLSRKSKAILDPSKVTNSTASNKLEEEPSNTMMATNMFSIVNPETVCNLLNLDDLGTHDPHQKKTKQKRAEETKRRTEWRFNLPSGPWWGDWWELLLGIIKQTRRKKEWRTEMRKRFRNDYLGKLARTAKKFGAMEELQNLLQPADIQQLSVIRHN
ncbi:hypothetical protein GE061_004683 [Apolygus lucorum]|uniref:DUF5641 domain-containing protein n=1 Tax=Apolygus lucorum TaxID=248454 RepID=A0A8S9X3W0_APOLU|nr:hypothetical protein GE061_004683 [Apolygus lucorum]